LYKEVRMEVSKDIQSLSEKIELLRKEIKEGKKEK